jgi:hypothetical protein
MSVEKHAFDHRADPVLGAALRQILDAGDQAAFVARVLAGYEHARTRAERPLWDVLAGWSRTGIVAAALTALVAGFLFGRLIRAPVGLDDVFASTATGDTASAVLVTAQRPPDTGVLLAGFER